MVRRPGWRARGQRRAGYERYGEQQANTFRTPLDIVPDAGPPGGDRGPDRPEMHQDYYTQPVGSDRHREAHRAYHEATHGSGAAFPDDPDLSYWADNADELARDCWEAEQGEDEGSPDPDQSVGPYGTFGHQMDTDQMLAGTREGDAEDAARMAPERRPFGRDPGHGVDHEAG